MMSRKGRNIEDIIIQYQNNLIFSLCILFHLLVTLKLNVDIFVPCHENNLYQTKRITLNLNYNSITRTTETFICRA